MPNPSSLAQELHLHDARSFNAVQVAYVGIDHAEFGRVVAESQRLIGEADSRAMRYEGVAQQVFLTSLVEELCGQNEVLQSGHNEKDVMISSLHEAVQDVKQTLENQIKFNQSMFEGQLRKAKDEIDRLSDLNQKSLNLLGHKDSEIQRLCQESSSRQDRISSLEAKLAASSARSSSRLRSSQSLCLKHLRPRTPKAAIEPCWSRSWKLFSHSVLGCRHLNQAKIARIQVMKPDLCSSVLMKQLFIQPHLLQELFVDFGLPKVFLEVRQIPMIRGVKGLMMMKRS